MKDKEFFADAVFFVVEKRLVVHALESFSLIILIQNFDVVERVFQEKESLTISTASLSRRQKHTK